MGHNNCRHLKLISLALGMVAIMSCGLFACAQVWSCMMRLCQSGAFKYASLKLCTLTS